MEFRAKSLAHVPKPGETLRNIKAVTTLPDGTEEIVGFASWTTCVGRGGSDGEKGRLGMTEGWGEKKVEGKEKNTFGPGANVKFCEDAFLRGDEHMMRSTVGRDYASEYGFV